MPSEYIAVDVETTGLDPYRGDRVIEVAAIRIVKGLLKDEFHTFIKSNRRISKHARRINGITDKMLIAAPPPNTAWPEFYKFIGNASLVAHNAKFDWSFIRHEFSLLGLPFGNPFKCTLKLSRAKFSNLPNYTLETIYKSLFGSIPDTMRLHSAQVDARLTAEIWIKLNPTQFAKESNKLRRYE